MRRVADEVYFCALSNDMGPSNNEKYQPTIYIFTITIFVQTLTVFEQPDVG